MKRRKFLQYSASAATLQFLLSRFPPGVLGQISSLSNAGDIGGKRRILVFIELNGGNDGLNTLIPLDQYKHLKNARGNILIPEDKILPLYNSSITGLHPSLSGIQRLYNSKMLTFIQGVGFHDSDFSHETSSRIITSGSDAKTVLRTGWMGRYLDQENTGFPTDYPNVNHPHPPAIRLGTTSGLLLQGESENLGIVVSTQSNFVNSNVSEIRDTPPMGIAGEKVSFIGRTSELAFLYSKVLKKAVSSQPNLVKYPEPETNIFADQLKVVAQLIGSGLKTPVYLTGARGFDMHQDQTDSSDPMKGIHAKMLSDLSEAISIFMDDIHAMGKQDEVIGITFSEFGRRILSNNSFGTDHGTSEPVILFGAKVKGGLVGVNPVIPEFASVNDNLEIQFDHRAVNASILRHWFGVKDEELKNTVLADMPLLDLVNV